MNPQSMDKLVQEAKKHFHSFIVNNRIDKIEFEFLNGVISCVKEYPEIGEKFVVAFLPDDVLCVWAWYYTKEGCRQLQTSSDVATKELPFTHQKLLLDIQSELYAFNKKNKKLIEEIEA